jgi:hypothetical protein
MMRALLTVIAVAGLMLPGSASAQTLVWFFGSGSGDLYENPPVFSGGMGPGGDITDGQWVITIDDSAWPPASDIDARRQYIYATFFEGNYVAGDPGYWSGYFDRAHGLSAPSEFYVEDYTNGGSMSGFCSLQMTVIDQEGDAELNGWDGCTGALSGFVSVVGGSGAYIGYEGEGSWCGTYVRDCPGSTTQVWDLSMYLWFDGPRVPAGRSSWGAIKALYK